MEQKYQGAVWFWLKKTIEKKKNVKANIQYFVKETGDLQSFSILCHCVDRDLNLYLFLGLHQCHQYGSQFDRTSDGVRILELFDLQNDTGKSGIQFFYHQNSFVGIIQFGISILEKLKFIIYILQ